MSYIEVEYPAKKPAFYAFLRQQLAQYAGDEQDRTAALANASAVLRLAFPQANWVGFYIVQGQETLWDIAKQYYLTPAQIMEMNGLESEKLKKGDCLILMKKRSY